MLLVLAAAKQHGGHERKRLHQLAMRALWLRRADSGVRRCSCATTGVGCDVWQQHGAAVGVSGRVSDALVKI
jgi:hypothetical protein